MIDEKINNSLKELEQSLSSIEAARKQVQETVDSYEDLKSTTAEYVRKLGNISTRIQELVNIIGKDYSQKIEDFERDREIIRYASNAATEKLSKATDSFKDSLSDIQAKLKYSLIINAILLVAISVLIFFLLK